jgi:hypothetical protein
MALLDPKQHPVLASALGDTPETVHSVHMLRRGLCNAYVAGDPARFDAAILQAVAWPREPTGFGADPTTLWALLQQVEGWTCILVDSGCAQALAAIIEAELGCQTRFLDDVTHLLTVPARGVPDQAVRRLAMSDLELLRSAPLELRAGLWPGPRDLLAEGIVACAVVSGEIVATALTAACTGCYADIGAGGTPPPPPRWWPGRCRKGGARRSGVRVLTTSHPSAWRRNWASKRSPGGPT